MVRLTRSRRLLGVHTLHHTIHTGMHIHGDGSVGAGLSKRGLHYAIRLSLRATALYVGHFVAWIGNTAVLEVRLMALSIHLRNERLFAHHGQRRFDSRHTPGVYGAVVSGSSIRHVGMLYVPATS